MTSSFLIVTPSYNQAPFIKQTLNSVLSQNQPIEYEVMDGGSKDGTVEILKQFTQTYGSKFRWQSEKDRGQADAINKGIEKLSQKLEDQNAIFAYINSDDYYLPEAFAKVAAAFAKHPEAQWLVGDCEIVDAQNRKIQQSVVWYKLLLRGMYFPSLLFVLNPIPQPAVFIRGAAVKKVGLFNDQLHLVLDYEYWLRLQQIFGPPLLINQKIAAFRIHGDSKGKNQFVTQFEQQFKIAKQYTQNPVLLFLHWMHNVLILAIYRLIK